MKKTIEYTREGYINMAALLDQERLPFVFITGVRGGGKTWGALNYAIRFQQHPFILMRRTQVQADFAGSIETSPLMSCLLPDEYLKEERTGVKNLSRIDVWRIQESDPIRIATCYILALSTVASMRGIDLSGCNYLIFDEFIKEPHERPIKEEFSAFLNAYETLNRNRELQGRKPMRVIALSNALDLANPYYRGFGLVNEVYQMPGEVWRDRDQGVAIYRPRSTRFMEQKAKTAAYQNAQAAKTMGNAWADMDLSKVKSQSLKTATPICSIDGVGFYKLNGEAYASATVPSGVPAYKLDDKIDQAILHRKHQGIVNAIFDRRVTFESVDTMLRCGEIAARL